MKPYILLMIISAIICFGCSDESGVVEENIENPCALEVGSTINITIFEEGNTTLIIGEDESTEDEFIVYPWEPRYFTEIEGCYKDLTMVVTRGELPSRINIGDVYKIKIMRTRGKWAYDIEIIEILLGN